MSLPLQSGGYSRGGVYKYKTGSRCFFFFWGLYKSATCSATKAHQQNPHDSPTEERQGRRYSQQSHTQRRINLQDMQKDLGVLISNMAEKQKVTTWFAAQSSH